MIRLVITTQILGWSPRKAEQMVSDIRLLLAQQGAPNSDIKVISATPDEVREARGMFSFMCKADKTEWEAPQYSECPKCGHRDTVLKREPMPKATQEVLLERAKSA